MQAWFNSVFASPQWSFSLIIASFLFGAFSAIGSCCNVGALGAIASYASSKEHKEKSDLLALTISFIFGTMLFLVILGLIISFTGKAISTQINYYGRFIMGILLVFFGLVTLDLFPISLPNLTPNIKHKSSGIFADLLFGFALGGGTLTCTLLCCSPLIPVLLTMSTMENGSIKSFIVILIFGIGYCLPLAGILMGFSYGTFAIKAQRIITIVKKIAGFLLIGFGFYFLATI